MHERRKQGLSCRGVDLRGASGLEGGTAKGAIEMVLERCPPSIRDWCLYFREVKVTSKYFFEGTVGLEQIRRLMAGYRMEVE